MCCWGPAVEYTVSAVLKDTVGELGIFLRWARSLRMTKRLEKMMSREGRIMQKMVSSREKDFAGDREFVGGGEED